MKTLSCRLSLSLWLLVSAAGAAVAQAPAPMSFTVSTSDPASHLFHVRFRCEGLSGGSAEFRMPVWTPGYYGVFDFAGNVRGFTAADADGHRLAVGKTGPSAWTVRTGGAATVVLDYDVSATTPFVANAYLDETRGYITPGALFVYVPGRLKTPVTVTVESTPGWRDVATGLEPVSGAPGRTFSAADFDVLYDSPILMGNLESLPAFEVRGVPHRFVGYALGDFDRRQFIDDLKAVVSAGVDIIGEVPYTHYTFLGIGPGRGGIEHLNSAAVSFSGIGADHAGRVRTLSFLAHEYFHHYNVKRIRPVALGPFDYDRPNLTEMLWVSEGFTVYYEYLMLSRSGRMTEQELLEALGGTIATCEKTSGRLFQSATASSRETWTQGPFGRGRGGVARTISYYDKGAVLGFLLDLRIRQATRNQRSLDTVMRTLYQRYYKQLGRGWTDAEFRTVCEDTAGTSLADIFTYASSTREVDYDTYLAYAGLRLDPGQALGEASLGALAEDVDGALTVAASEPRSPAARAGLVGGDVIVSVDGATVDRAGLDEAVAAHKPGDRLRIVVRRGGRERTLTALLDAKRERTWRLVPRGDATPQQHALLSSLVSGR